MSAPRRILLVANRLWTGGAESVLADLATGLGRRGHAVRRAFLYAAPGTAPRAGDAVLLDRQPGPADLPRTLRRLWSLLRRERPHAVIAFHPKSNLLVLAVAALAGVPVRIATEHTLAAAQSRTVRRAERLARAWGVQTTAVAVSAAVLRSHGVRPRAAGWAVVANGIEPVAPAADGAAGWLPPGRPLLASVGRLDPVKGHRRLVRALADLPGVHLAIAGEGAERPVLRDLARRLGVADRLHLLGDVPRDRLPALLARADVAVFPSHYEGFGLALLEALSAGCAVVASDIPAHREVVGTAAAALLVPAGDDRGWSAAIRCVLTDTALCAELRRAGAARARAFSLAAMAAGYERLLGRRAVRPRAAGPRAVRALGLRLDALDRRRLHALLETAQTRARPTLVLNHNLHSAAVHRADARMRALYAQADAICFDSMPLLRWAQLTGQGVDARHRLAWLDELPAMLGLAVRHGWLVMHVGGRPGVGEEAARRLRARHPGLRIETHHGYLAPGSAEDAAVVARIRAARPNLLFVGMGMPRQEHWVLEHLAALPPCAVLTSGGTFDCIGGALATAPRWLGPLCLEWAWRLGCEPRRLAHRYLVEPWALLPQALGDLRRRARADGVPR